MCDLTEDCFGYRPDCPRYYPKNNKESDMYHVNTVAIAGASSLNMEQDQRSLLQDRLFTFFDKKRTKLRIQYGLSNMNPPRNGKELVARIQAGEYVLDESLFSAGGPSNCSLSYGITWRKPDVKEDHAGFNTAIEKLSKAHDLVTLDAAILPLPEALASVRAFEAQTFN